MKDTKKAQLYRSKILQELLDEMERDSWYVKFKRWLRLKYWFFYCDRIRPIRKFLGYKNY